MKTIETRYLPATNTRPARIKAIVEDGPIEWQLVRTYQHEDMDTEHANAAQALAQKIRWTQPMIGGHTPNGMVWVIDNAFAPRINQPQHGAKETAA